jgi:hypothetical protein
MSPAQIPLNRSKVNRLGTFANTLFGLFESEASPLSPNASGTEKASGSGKKDYDDLGTRESFEPSPIANSYVRPSELDLAAMSMDVRLMLLLLLGIVLLDNK